MKLFIKLEVLTVYDLEVASCTFEKHGLEEGVVG